MKHSLLLQAVLMFPLQEMRRGTRAVMLRLLHRTALVIVVCLLGLAVIPGGTGEAARDPFSPACLEHGGGKSPSVTRTAWRSYQECARFLAGAIKKGVAANDRWDVQALLEWARALQVCSKTDDPLLCAAKLDRVAALTPLEAARPAPAPQVPRPQSGSGGLFQRPGPDLSTIREGSEPGLKESDDEKVRGLTEALRRGQREIEDRESRRKREELERGFRESQDRESGPSWLDRATRRLGITGDFFFDLLIFGGLAWVIVSPLIFIYWHMAPRKRDGFQSRHGNIVAAANIGTFVSSVFVLSIGIRSLLIFLPASWGWYDEGEFVQAREWVSALLGTLATFFLTHIYEKAEKLRKVENLHKEYEKQGTDADQTPE